MNSVGTFTRVGIATVILIAFRFFGVGAVASYNDFEFAALVLGLAGVIMLADVIVALDELTD